MTITVSKKILAIAFVLDVLMISTLVFFLVKYFCNCD